MWRWRSGALGQCETPKTRTEHITKCTCDTSSQFLTPPNYRKRTEKRIISDLLPVLLQGRHRREITSVMDELEFLEDTVIRQHIHAWCEKTGKVSKELRDPNDINALLLSSFSDLSDAKNKRWRWKISQLVQIGAPGHFNLKKEKS